MKKILYGAAVVTVSASFVLSGVLAAFADGGHDRSPKPVSVKPPEVKETHVVEQDCDSQHAKRVHKNKHDTGRDDDDEADIDCATVPVTMTQTPLVVTSPIDNQLLNTSTVMFAGTSTPAALIVALSGTTTVATTTANSVGDWNIVFSLAEGTTTMSFIAKDATESTSTMITRSVFVDSLPPAPVVVTVPACVNSLTTENCAIVGDSILITWSIVPDAVHYQVFINGQLATDTKATSALVPSAPNTTNNIAVVDFDAAGNVSTSTTVSAITYTHPLLINEINWAGSLAVPTNQWIELKNTTPFTLNLSHITLVGTGGEYIPLSGTISPQTSVQYSGFYLIENNGELFSADTRPADLTAPLSLSPTGEQFTLLLTTPAGTTTVDQTPAVATCSGWCAGTTAHVIGSSLPGETGVPPNTLSMERASAADGTLSTSWHSNDTYTQNGVYSFGVTSLPTYGTPGSENSVGEPADYGFFCSPDTLSIIPNQTYTPHSSHCTYLARFLGFPVTLSAALFKGTPGNATLVNLHTFVNQEHGGGIDTIVGNPGDTFFTALWQQRQYTPNDDTYFTSYFTTGQYVDGNTLVSTTPPHTLFRVLPWVMGN